MRIKIITIFPDIFSGFFTQSLIGKAVEGGLLELSAINLRDFSEPPHYRVDDTPYGGGAGMVLKPEPLALAIEATKKELPDAKVILLSANGSTFTQQAAEQLSLIPEVILICGRYEGVDQRVIDLYIDQEISIGDYVLMGGEVAAMVVIEATTRLISNVLGNPESVTNESFAHSDRGRLLEGPQYTRPASFRNQGVPEILLSGDHQKISLWRKEMARQKTTQLRPDLLKGDRE